MGTARLKKRSPIDGFEREDIFYIDPAGCSTAAVFHEAQHLLRGQAVDWFDTLGTLDMLIDWMVSRQDSRPSDELDLGLIAAPRVLCLEQRLGGVMAIERRPRTGGGILL